MDKSLRSLSECSSLPFTQVLLQIKPILWMEDLIILKFLSMLSSMHVLNYRT